MKGHITNDQYNTYKQQLIDMANQGLWKRDLNKYIFQRMVHQQYNVAIRGTNERMDYAFSASFDDEKGYQRGNGNRRVMLNLSSNVRLTDHLSFDLAVNTTFNKEENNGTDPAVIKTWLSPWARLADDEGNFVHVPTGSTIYQPIYESKYAGKVPADWTYNPALDRRYTGNDADALNLRVQGGFTYKTDWGLTLSAKGQYERRDYDSHSSWDPESFTVRDYYNTYSTLNSATGMYSSYFPQGGIFTDSGNKYEAYNLRGQADYNRTFGKHAVSALVGTEIISATTDANPSITRYGYNSYTNSVLTAPDYVGYYTDIFGVRGHLPFDELGTLSTLEDRFFSVYANASYTYNDRYSLTASFRTDASNFQAEDVRKKFSPFWSVGGSWLISREDFMADVSWVDQLKLRASYGIAGVAAGRSGTSSVTTVEVWPGSVDFTGNEAFNTIAQRGNPSLTWEKSRTVNIGVDFGLFGNKLFGSVDFYNKYSYDVLSSATVPAISQGTTSATFNNAEVLNRGVEFSVGTNLRIVDDLRWSGTLNYAFNHNEVTKFNLTSQYPAVFNHGFVEGYPVDFYAVLKPVGYTPEGFVLLQGKDGTQEALTDMDSSHAYEQVYRNEGETLDDNNWAYYLGSPTPKSNLSFTNTFTWRGLTLSFMITGRFGYYVERGDFFNYDSNSPYFSKQLENSFRVYDEGYANQKSYSAFPLYTDDSFPVYQATGGYMDAYNAQLVFDRAYIKGDHIRLNEVYLGYDLPSKWLDKQKVFNRVNVYFKANNLGCIWKANGEMDPDYTLGSLKPMPTFMLGLKVNFKSK